MFWRPSLEVSGHSLAVPILAHALILLFAFGVCVGLILSVAGANESHKGGSH